MTTNSTILYNLSPEDLRSIIRECIREERTEIPGGEQVPELYSVKETAKKLRISQPTLTKLEKEGKLHSVRIGMKKFYNHQDIMAFLDLEKSKIK